MILQDKCLTPQKIVAQLIKLIGTKVTPRVVLKRAELKQIILLSLYSSTNKGNRMPEEIDPRMRLKQKSGRSSSLSNLT